MLRAISEFVMRFPARLSPQILATVCCSVFVSPRAIAEEEPVSFVADVAPILVKNCVGCHGSEEAEGEYQLTSFERLLRAGASESPAVTPGKPDESELIRLVESEDEGERMPYDADPLPPAEIALLRQWVEQGAKFDGSDPQAALASLVVRPPHPRPPERYRRPFPVTALAFSPDGSEIAVSGYHEVTIWNTRSGELLLRLEDLPERIYGLDFHPQEKLLAVAAGNPGQLGEVCLLDVQGEQSVAVFARMADVALAARFSPSGERLAAVGADRSLRIFNVATQQEEILLEDHADWVMDVTWSTDGKHLATASRDKTAKLFSVQGESLITYPGHGDAVYAVAFSPDGKRVFSAGRDKRIHVWDTEEGKKRSEIGGFGGDIFSLVVGEESVFGASGDHMARQFNLKDRNKIRDYAGHRDWIYAMVLDPQSKLLATGGYDGQVKVWNTQDGSLVREFIAAPGWNAKTASAP